MTNEQSGDFIRVLVVDDERLSRERLRTLLEAEPDVVIVGESENGIQALDAITRLRPELVFLDMQMPDLDGPGVLDALVGCADEVPCPEIVFVTAYNAYMERAFEVHAVDYLRKPYTTVRFQSALAHSRRQVLSRRVERGEPRPAPYAAAVAALQPERDNGRIFVHAPDIAAWHGIPTEEVDWIEADGSAHVRLHRGAASYRWRKSLGELEQQLTPRGFLRVHRSHIVNTARIRSVKSLQKGEFTLLLDGGAVIDTGRTFRDVVLGLLERL